MLSSYGTSAGLAAARAEVEVVEREMERFDVAAAAAVEEWAQRVEEAHASRAAEDSSCQTQRK